MYDRLKMHGMNNIKFVQFISGSILPVSYWSNRLSGVYNFIIPLIEGVRWFRLIYFHSWFLGMHGFFNVLLGSEFSMITSLEDRKTPILSLYDSSYSINNYLYRLWQL
jgi:hypothetical protein